ncbi:uncharacterized protein ACA1_158950 [Acanthamoeba castellanii str. Neff]|uniref:Uncharacterized protein n=1 Tax=Acanthamoeba castellanii (strain ATCC 30010 / Neff) TaxID=1257118 RepID=L8H9E1_ACACF|nr:uncharacterized protein ACA1_158950 [Acanthamoeba castellanii str. Neff]ELR22099.1 hypothetical protein ACA1_158950 [Acanthamoeba castellanii str. Neff]
MEELTTKLEAFHNNPDERNQKEAAIVEDLNRFFAAHNKTPDCSSRSSFTETAPSPDFVAQFGWATRAAFVAALLGTLRAPDCVRRCCVCSSCARGRLNTQKTFAQPEVLELMLAHTNLGVDDHVEDVDGASSRQRHPVAVAAEALRCIVNLVHHSPAALAPRLYATVGMRPFLRALEREPDPTYRLSLLRLVFNCSLEKSANLPELQAQGALRLAIRVLAHALDHIKGGDGADNDDEQEQVATEALRLILNLTLHLGPLSNPPNPLPKPDEVESWQQLVPHIHRVMELGAGHQRLQHFAVAVLVNTPQGCAHHFRIDTASVDSLLDFLRRQFDHPDETQVAPVLMVLVAIAKGIPALRDYMMARCFPAQPPPLSSSKPIEPPSNWMENEIGSRLLKLMTAVNYGLKHYVNEFIYVLCAEDVDAFVRITGLGNAAGWLATRNLFQGFQKMGSAAPTSTSSSSSSRATHQAKAQTKGGPEDEQEENENENENENEDEYEEDELGRLRRRGHGGEGGGGGGGDDGERDEASLLELIGKLERLQQLGVISVMPANNSSSNNHGNDNDNEKQNNNTKKGDK